MPDRLSWGERGTLAVLVVAGAGTALAERFHRLRDRWRGHEEQDPPVDPDPLGLVGALERTGRFCRDTVLGGLFHRDGLSVRENAPQESLHVTLSGTRLSAHIDRLSPLADDHASWVARYSVPRAIAHGLAHLAGMIRRIGVGRPGSHRVELDCELMAAATGDDRSPTADPARKSATSPGQRRLPFTMVEEAIQILDAEAAPWAIQLEVDTAGRLDEARLRRAIRQGLLRHPLAHARRVPAHAAERTHEWELVGEVEVDPLRVGTCPDPAALAVARSDFYSRGVPLAESPPLRVRLVRRPHGDLVMFNVNHVALDGFAALRVVRSVARAYRGEPDPVPAVDLRATRDLGRLFEARDAGARRARYRLLADKLRDLLGPPARLAPDGGSNRPGYGFHHVSLSAGQTRALVDGARGTSTVNDLLLAALNLTVARWNAEHGASCRRVGVLVPVNLWPDRPAGVAGNYALPVRVTTTAGDRTTPHRLVERITAQTTAIKQDGTGAALLEILGVAAGLPIWAKRALPGLLWVTGDRLVDTAMLSNLGRVDRPPRFGEGSLDTAAMWFSPPARMPLGLAVGALTVGDRLHLAFRYRHPLLGDDAAARLAELYVRGLTGLVGAPADGAAPAPTMSA